MIPGISDQTISRITGFDNSGIGGPEYPYELRFNSISTTSIDDEDL
jgi:hypothetical protein